MNVLEAIRKATESISAWAAGKFATGWNDLKGKPVVTEGGDTLTWDGNTEGLVSVDITGLGTYYKISDAAPTVDELNAAFLTTGVGTEDEVTLPIGIYTAEKITDGLVFWRIDDGTCFSVDASVVGVDLGGASFSEPGLYFTKINTAISLTIPGYTGFGKKEVLDPGLLPKIPSEKLPRSVILYADAENYLYADSDTSDTTKRITKAQLQAFFEPCRPIYLSLSEDGFDIYWVGNAVAFTDSYAGIQTWNGVALENFYTAEYTAD